MGILEGIFVAVAGSLIAWRVKRHFRFTGEARTGECEQAAQHDETADELELDDDQQELLQVLAKINPDDWLDESSISRRLNRKVSSHVSRQHLRFLLEGLEKLELIDPGDLDEDDVTYWRLAELGREFVGFGLMD